jgi:hypothetical protein
MDLGVSSSGNNGRPHWRVRAPHYPTKATRCLHPEQHLMHKGTHSTTHPGYNPQQVVGSTEQLGSAPLCTRFLRWL